MATIRPRKGKKGTTYEVQIRIKGHEPVTDTFTKMTIAREWATTTEAAMREGRHKNTKTAEKTLMADLADKYLELVLPTKETSSHIPDRARIGTLKRFFGEKALTLGGTTIDDVLEYVRRRQQVVSDDSVRRELLLWSDIIDSAVSLWKLHIVANPVINAKRILKKLRMLKPGVERERRLRPGEYEKIKTAKSVRTLLIREVAMFAIETAMRQAELARARREHVDKAKRVIYVPKSKMDWLTGNKGKVVPLSPRALEIIENLPVSFIEGSLFGMNAEQIKKGWIRLCRNEKLDDLHFHDLCHEATSRLFEAGFTIAEVSAITGKKDWRTLERYTHPDAEKLALRMR